MQFAVKTNISGRPCKRSFGAAALCACVLWFTLIISAQAQTADDNRIDIDIPTQELSIALREFADQAGLQILYSADLIGKGRLVSLQGSFTRDDALRLLLEGTGLEFLIDGRGNVAIRESRGNTQSSDNGHSEFVGISANGQAGPEDGEILLAQGDTSAPTDENGSAESDSPEQIYEEILVTATRRAAPLKSLAMSGTAFSGADLANSAADDLSDFVRSVPGVELQSLSPGLNRVTMRGISSLAGEATVGYYIDEMAVTADQFSQPDLKMFDIERVEIFRGPQGTLFGEGAMGGVIRFITSKPDTDGFDAAFRVSTLEYSGGDSGYGVDGMLNLPLIDDRLALRGVVSYRDEGGFIDDPGRGISDVNGYEMFSTRWALRFDATDDLSITLNLQHQESETAGTFIADDNFEQQRAIDETRDDDYDQFNVTIEYDAGSFTFTNSTSYFDREIDSVNDLSRIFLPLLGIFFPGTTFNSVSNPLLMEYDILTNEARFVSPGDQRLRWSVGAYYKTSSRDRTTSFDAEPATPIPLFDDQLLIDFDQIALFSELEYDFTDRLHGTIGLRWFEEDRKTRQIGSGLFVGPPVDVTIDQKDDAVTPRFALSYDINDDVMLYTNIAKGFRSGGANPGSVNVPGSSSSYGPESLWSYELGIKSAFLDNRLIINAAVFDNDWTDKQQVDPSVIIAPITVNVGKAHSTGIEWEIVARPSDSLEFRLNGTSLEAELDEDSPPLVKGDRLPFVPEETLGVSAQFTRPVTSNLDWTLLVGYTMTGDQVAFGSAVDIPDYELLNLRTGLEADRWDLSLFARNLNDEHVRIQPDFGTEFVVGEPTVIGLMFNYRY